MDKIAPGRYVIAVSGGVDSMVLLDMVRQLPHTSVVVAHVDHGIRPDSHQDAALVATYVQKYGLTFCKRMLRLGADVSEAAARKARYDFLQQCRKKYNADAVMLAHHQDDLIETALLALMRGTGWRGLAPFMPRPDMLRPLLHMTKNQLIGYARANHVPWREDSTNLDERYTRNYIRRTLIPLLDQKVPAWEQTFLQHIRKQQEIRISLQNELTKWLDKHAEKNNIFWMLPRYNLIMAPAGVAYELVQQICVQVFGHTLERPLAESALLFCKVARPGKVLQLSTNWQLRAESANIVVESRQLMVS